MRVHVQNFSLQQTLESGQLFRYEIVPEGFLVSHRNKAFVISQEGDELKVHYCTPNVNDAWLSHFFSLDQDVPKAVDGFSSEALEYCSGLRVCRQDPWECTIGFVCSQNNNVKRIRQLMTGLAREFGQAVKIGPHQTYLFPEPGKIRSGTKLQSIRSGYREKYLLALNNQLTDENLAVLFELPYEEARVALQSLPGIGPKVADCILLFAFGHTQAFPVDTWVEKIMREEYGSKTRKEMRTHATKNFGNNAGIMQQYLFHYKRTKENGLQKNN